MKGNARNTSEHRNNRPDIVIREMEIDDIATVFHMGERLFKAREVPNLYRTWDEYEVIAYFQGDADLCLVAEVEDRVVGYILGTTVTKSRSAWKYGLMAWLGVDPACQRMGIATRLFNELRDRLIEQGVRMLLVDTEADNDDALRFFDRVGFGNPEEHLYLSMNLASRQQKLKARNGRSNRKPG